MKTTIKYRLQVLAKWVVCSWLHRRYRCYPTVWGPEAAKKYGFKYEPNFWHCTKCHPCGEGLSKLNLERERPG